MNDTQLETLDQVRQFLEGTEAVSFQIESKDARYRWLQQTLVKFRYPQLSKTDKGLIPIQCKVLRSSRPRARLILIQNKPDKN